MDNNQFNLFDTTNTGLPNVVVSVTYYGTYKNGEITLHIQGASQGLITKDNEQRLIKDIDTLYRHIYYYSTKFIKQPYLIRYTIYDIGSVSIPSIIVELSDILGLIQKVANIKDIKLSVQNANGQNQVQLTQEIANLLVSLK